MPSDGKPEHELPYTPEGRQAFMTHKPTYGITQVPSALTNDPMPGCDPQGFPRIVLHNAHTEETITIDDPKYYTRPWVALDKLPYRLQPPGFDIPEQECVPSETAKYNEIFANPAAGLNDAGK